MSMEEYCNSDADKSRLHYTGVLHSRVSGIVSRGRSASRLPRCHKGRVQILHLDDVSVLLSPGYDFWRLRDEFSVLTYAG